MPRAGHHGASLPAAPCWALPSPLGVCSPATARERRRGRKGGDEHTAQREGAQEGTRGALVQLPCAQHSVPTGTGQLSCQTRAVSRKGEVGPVAYRNQQGTTTALSSQHGPACALTLHPEGSTSHQRSWALFSSANEGSLSRVKQSGHPFLLCDLPGALGAIPGTSFSACSLLFLLSPA